MSITGAPVKSTAFTAPYLSATSIIFFCFLRDLEESGLFITRSWRQDLLVPRIPGVYLN